MVIYTFHCLHNVKCFDLQGIYTKDMEKPKQADINFLSSFNDTATGFPVMDTDLVCRNMFSNMNCCFCPCTQFEQFE